MKEYLPIGTVVKIKGNECYQMIMGLKLENASNSQRYDYTSIMYPMGFNPKGEFLMFNNSDIEEVYHKGFESMNHESYIDQLKAVLHIDEYTEYDYSQEEVDDFFNHKKGDSKAKIDSSFVEL